MGKEHGGEKIIYRCYEHPTFLKKDLPLCMIMPCLHVKLKHQTICLHLLSHGRTKAPNIKSCSKSQENPLIVWKLQKICTYQLRNYWST